MIMKKVSVVLLCLFAFSCASPGVSNNNSQTNTPSGGSTTTAGTSTGDGPVTFSLVQPLGQKSSYETKMILTMDAQAPPGVQGPQTMSIVANMNMGMDTEVTATNPDGTWTVATKISNMKMDGTMNGTPLPLPPQAANMPDQSYVVTYDKNGKVVSMSGGTNPQSEQQVKDMLQNMNPSAMLPPNPVKVGDTWPISMDMAAPGPTGQGQKMQMKGTGRLTEIKNQEAKLDYDLTIQMEGEQVNATGKGNSTVLYDLGKSRVVSSLMDMKIDDLSLSTGRGQSVKSNMTMKMQMDLK